MTQVNLTIGYSAEMIACWCGDVFRAAGWPDDVRAKQQEWSVKHANCKEVKREGQKVFWLSFCDADRPKGQQFLGACVVEVTAEEADEAAFDVLLRFPLAQTGSEWIAAAMSKSHRLGCNPGGEVASMEIEPDNPNLSRYTLGVLMDRATIAALDRVQ